MPVHLRACRPRSLADRKMRSTFTCILDSLAVWGIKRLPGNFGESSAKAPRKTGGSPWSLLQGSAHPFSSASVKARRSCERIVKELFLAEVAFSGNRNVDQYDQLPAKDQISS